MRWAVLTTGRQDWGLLRPLCEALRQERESELLLIVGGMACAEKHGKEVERVRAQGFDVADELPWSVEFDAAVQASEALASVHDSLQRLQPTGLILLGDRFETAAAALAATLAKVPIIHLYGGEETEGAIDNSLRHAITKLSHLHFVTHDTYARRVRAMGEDPSNVYVVGSLAVDNIQRLQRKSIVELEDELEIALEPPIGLVTVHPTTLCGDRESTEVDAVAVAIDRLGGTWLVTLPNSDTGNRIVRQTMQSLAARNPRVHAFEALGETTYLQVMAVCDVVLGNSSSGLTEAPILGVPTVNVGDRQKGRMRCPSIIDVPPDPARIADAISVAIDEDFRAQAGNVACHLGSGDSATLITNVLRSWNPPRPPRKRFHDSLLENQGG